MKVLDGPLVVVEKRVRKFSLPIGIYKVLFKLKSAG
jgi:hypothetical protein